MSSVDRSRRLAWRIGLCAACGVGFGDGLFAFPRINVGDYPIVFSKENFPQGAGTHLPSLLVTGKGTVIAVCQLRKGSVQDLAHDIDLLVRRSLNGGRTWEAVGRLFTEAGVNAVNGEIVEDRATGEIIVPFTKVPSSVDTKVGYLRHFVQSGGGFWALTSRNEGQSWSMTRKLLPQGPQGWQAWPSNSGHGIQLASGRLVIGAFVHKPSASGEPLREMEFRSGLLYSDDHGRNWKIGASAPFDGTDELAIVETSAGDILANIRLNNRNPADLVRYYARSRDGAESFAETGLQDHMSLAACHAGMTRWRRDGRDILLYSGPQGSREQMSRTTLAVRLSYDSGRTWPVARILTGTKDSAEYSDLAVASDGTILCLYGEHTFEAGAGSVIRLIRLRMDEIEVIRGPRD